MEKNKKVDITEAVKDPVTFAYALGLTPYPVQCHTMWRLQKRNSMIALRAANESGKTSHVACPFILWHTLAFPNSKTVVTAGAWRQIKDILFPEMRRFAHFFPKWEFQETKIQADNGSVILGISTNDPGLFEGHHNENLLIVADEAKSIFNEIFEAITRCGPTRLLIMSSPGMPLGYFYECFFAERAKLFEQFKLTAYDCPHITKEKIARVEAEYPKTSAFFRSMIEAEFTTDLGARTLIKSDHLEKCLLNPSYERNPWDIRAFCDFSWSADGDENVLALRRGNKITLEDCWAGDGSTIHTAHRFINNFKRLNLKAEQIWGDNGGGGHGVIDVLESMGWSINRINNGATANDSDKFCNQAIEWWWIAARRIENCEIILPNDPILKAQLISRSYDVDTKNRMKLESKSIIGKSPDRADAVIGAMQDSLMITQYNAFGQTNWADYKPGFSMEDRKARGYVTADGFDLGG